MVTAETVARVLRAMRVGTIWMARCPAHDDHTPSLSIAEAADGNALVNCHAGCAQQSVISALRARGAWEPEGLGVDRRLAAGAAGGKSRVAEPKTVVDRSEAALAIWRECSSAEGTPVKQYLRSRGLEIALPDSIRFHAGLKHPSGGVWPTMVALVTRGVDEAPVAIHRTFLARDGSGKAPVEPAKMMLGPCKGGVVRLAEPSGVLMVGEGIETSLAAMQATGQAAWAALSTSGLRGLDLPHDVRDVIVLADGDDPGEMAALESASRWKLEDRRVRIARPPKGMDFADLLVSGSTVGHDLVDGGATEQEKGRGA